MLADFYSAFLYHRLRTRTNQITRSELPVYLTHCRSVARASGSLPQCWRRAYKLQEVTQSKIINNAKEKVEQELNQQRHVVLHLPRAEVSLDLLLTRLLSSHQKLNTGRSTTTRIILIQKRY